MGSSVIHLPTSFMIPRHSYQYHNHDRVKIKIFAWKLLVNITGSQLFLIDGPLKQQWVFLHSTNDSLLIKLLLACLNMFVYTTNITACMPY
jgi:hypothetical protein